MGGRAAEEPRTRLPPSSKAEHQPQESHFMGFVSWAGSPGGSLFSPGLGVGWEDWGSLNSQTPLAWPLVPQLFVD